MDSSRYFVVEGPVGAGKTDLARKLATKFGGRVVLEETEENPYLRLFHHDRKRYGFQSQVSFLLSRCRQQAGLTVPDLFTKYLVSDFLPERGGMFARVTLAPEDFALFQRLSAQLLTGVMPPDLVIYLQASVPGLLGRINKYGRVFERDMDRPWLENLVDSYNSWFLRERKYPVLVVRSDNIDFIRDEKAFEGLVDAIESFTGGVESYNPLPQKELF